MSIYLEILASVVRYAVAILAAHLIDHHVITSAQGDALASATARDAVLVAVMLAPIVWSAYSRYRDHLKREGWL